MNFSTASNSAVRTSGLVTINNVYFEASTRSIVVYCADNTRRLCRIDRCETIEAARSLYKDAKALEGFDAFFSAAGGNDPRKWFFAVEGAPVYDETPDVIFGMTVEEPTGYEAAPLTIGEMLRHQPSDEVEMESAEEGAMSALGLHEDNLETWTAKCEQDVDDIRVKSKVALLTQEAVYWSHICAIIEDERRTLAANLITVEDDEAVRILEDRSPHFA